MGKDDAQAPKTITIDTATLNELIDAKVRAGIAEAQAKGVAEGADFERAMGTIRGGDKPAAKVWQSELCESPITGSRFNAKLMESRSTPLGRVVDLENYEFPAGIDVAQQDGGLMPDAHIASPPEVHAHWKYWEFVRRDLIEYASGKPFTRYILKSEADRRRALDAEAAKAASPVAAE